MVILVHGIGMPTITFSTAPDATDSAPDAGRTAPEGGPRAFLTLTIGRREYGLTVVGDTFTLEGTRGQVYEVTRGDDPACSCKDFEMRHRGLPTQGCKHIRSLREVDLLPPAPIFPEAIPIGEWASELDIARFFGMAP